MDKAKVDDSVVADTTYPLDTLPRKPEMEESAVEGEEEEGPSARYYSFPPPPPPYLSR